MLNRDIHRSISMKNLIKVICASVLVFASLTAVAKPVYVSLPPVQTTSVVPADASGYWYSSTYGLKFSVVAGSYFASLPSAGLANCGKILKVTGSIPRNAAVPYWQYVEGSATDSNNVGIAYGTPFNLLTRQSLAGTISITAYDPVNDYLTVQVSTSSTGPNGTYTLSRDPLVPRVAAIVPNCQ